ncbi:MAG: sce7726 family protein [Gemmatimonadota bacterium]|nr:sce7726 family protein [Gemmatimonadota bacterium]
MLEGVTETETCGFVQDGGSIVAAVSPGSARESVDRDMGVRPVLRRYLDQQQLACPDTVLIEELGLCQGLARIDLATVSSVLHGYEIKSNRDRLSRLASQAETYSRVFDRVTLVVGTKHIKAALKLVPRWWGLLLVRGDVEGVLLDPFRPADENPGQDPRALVELLWRDEALELLARHNAAGGVRSKPRPAVWDRVCEALDLTQIRSAVRYRLRTRAETSTSASLR